MGYFGWVGAGKALLWVGGSGWGCMGHYFGWVGASRGGWDIILGGWWWVGVGALFDNAHLKRKKF